MCGIRHPALIENLKYGGGGTYRRTRFGTLFVTFSCIVGMGIVLGFLAPSAAALCSGDCNGDGSVTIDEVVTGVRMLLGEQPTTACPIDANGDGFVTVDELIAAVNSVLIGCTPGATPSPTATEATTVYRLVEGSTILSSPAPVGANGLTLEEPLSGTFAVVSRPSGGPFCLNTILCLAVTEVQFLSAHFTVTGSTGQILQTTFQPDFVSMNLTTDINGQSILLGGFGPFDANSVFPPPFNAVQICGAPAGLGGTCAGIRAGSDMGYDVMIFAVPTS